MEKAISFKSLISRYRLDVFFSVLVHNFNNTFLNEPFYRVGRAMNSLPRKYRTLATILLSMSKFEDLKRNVWRITEIFINAKENFSYCYHLHKPDRTEEEDYLKIDRDLQFIRHSLWRLSIIELSKLFSDRKSTDKFNLPFFISKLKPGKYYASIKIDTLKIMEWEKTLNEENELIRNIVTLRDKIYAHTDPNKDDYRGIEIYFAQIEKLFELIETIIKEINIIAFGIHVDLRTPTYDRRDFNLVKILSDFHNKEIEEIEKYLKK